MARSKQGSVVRRGERIYARIRWTERRDNESVIREKLKRVRTISEGRERCKQMLRDLEERGTGIFESDRMTFNDLARIYAERKLIPAQYHDDRKIAGLRSLPSAKAQMRSLQVYFGNFALNEITHSDLERFKLLKMQMTTRWGSRPSIATVNRELERMRAMLRFAVRQGYLLKTPFEMGESLISKADERMRERLLTIEEERRLIEACKNSRAHLRPIIICAIDTGMRRGEIFKLKWSDVSLDDGIIRLRATTTKTGKRRIIGITTRLEAELRGLWDQGLRIDDALVFGIKSDIKRSFASACRIAGISDLRFHDLRHRASLDLLQAGLSEELAMKILGHTQRSTFSRYINPDHRIAREAATALGVLQITRNQEGVHEKNKDD